MTTTTQTLPPVRNLAAYGYNETEEDLAEGYYREIEDAICAGKVLGFISSSERHGNGSPKQEVSLTCFRDPRANELRYAVEIWNDGRTGKYDYADRKEAAKSVDEWVQLIGVRTTGR